MARTHELSASDSISLSETVEIVSSPAAVAAQTQLRTHGRHLRWTEPTEPGGAWMLEVFDAEGKLIDGGMGDDPEDALLEVAERLLPPEGT
jgi:hypothetical protein